jgi:hypothetical protein
MPRIQGVGPRVAARVVEMGYVRRDGKPDVRRFAQLFDYDKTLVYEWIGDRRTPTKELDRLCVDLQVSHGWLLYGEGAPPPYKPMTPIAGGSALAQLPLILRELNPVPLIGSWLRQWVWPLHPWWAWA